MSLPCETCGRPKAAHTQQQAFGCGLIRATPPPQVFTPILPSKSTAALLASAQARIEHLEAALHEIAAAPCDASGVKGPTCACCLHDRMLASAALAK